MTIQKPILWGIIALALPFLLVAVILFQGVKSFEGTEYRVRITGYDPRDILRGHYVQFRYEWPSVSQCKPNQICAACFSGNPKRPQIIIKSFIQENLIAQDQSCQVYWRLNNVAKPEDVPQPVAELLRFYIPELEAPQLERLLRLNQDRFEIGVIPHADGTAVAKNLYINDKRLSDYLKD
jgi:hypothetical protein